MFPRNFLILKARFLRAFFSLLYHQLAWAYDLVADIVSLGCWKSWVSSLISHIHDGKILEIGHGPGHLLVQLSIHNTQIFGLDESHQMGRIAFRNLRNSGFNPRLVRGYAQQVPFPDGCFHQVVATFPSEFILDPLTISELYRVLIPTGSLIILPAAWLHGISPIHKAAAWLFRATDQVAPWSPDQLSPFTQVGFKIQTKHCKQKAWSTIMIFAQKDDENRCQLPEI